MKHTQEIEDQALVLGYDLDYEPEVIMEDIRNLPDSYWHMSRLTGFGGSDEGSLNDCGYTSHEYLVTQKIMGVSPDVDDASQYMFDYGHIMESLLLKNYAIKKSCDFITYKEYFVIVEDEEDVTKAFPYMKRSMKDVYSFVTKDKEQAEKIFMEVASKYSNVSLDERDTGEPKDVREITEEEFQEAKYGIVCVDRRQYRHARYPHVYGDCDGLCILKDAESMEDCTRIGIECKTYGSVNKGAFKSGKYGEDGALKGINYYFQVMHYMSVLNIDKFDVIACCDNSLSNFTITRVERDISIEQMLMENCEEVWKNEVENVDIRPAKEFPEKEAEKINSMIKKSIELTSDDYGKAEEIVVDEETKELIERYDELKKKRSKNSSEKTALDKEYKNLENDIIDKLGRKAMNVYCVDKGMKYNISLKPTISNSFNKDALLEAHPEMAVYNEKSEKWSFKFSSKEIK